MNVVNKENEDLVDCLRMVHRTLEAIDRFMIRRCYARSDDKYRQEWENSLSRVADEMQSDIDLCISRGQTRRKVAGDE